MTTENIKAIFADYLKTEDTQYAILLNGGWGSGKSFFWKNTLAKIAEENNLKPIYLSLNGVSKIERLEHTLFLKLFPFIANQENKVIKNTTTFLTNIANQASKHFLKSSLTDVFKGLSVDTFDFSKNVICFDDLERCQIPVKEVLGFINNYVEHKSLKTIILADESNIDISQKGYDSIKEKVIGRILKFQLDIKETLPVFFKKYQAKNKDFYKFLLKNETIIANILEEYKQDNLRIISFFLDVLEKVFPSLLNIQEVYVQEVILFSCIISIEFKRGKLTSSSSDISITTDDIVRIHYSDFSPSNTSDLKKESEKQYNEIFYETYLQNRLNDYCFYSTIYNYILTGFIDISDLTSEITKRKPEELSDEIKGFRVLLNYKFRELEDNHFEKYVSDVLKYAGEGRYTIYDYIQIAKFYYFFADNKIIDYTIESIDNLLFQGLEIAKSKNEINDVIFENKFYFEDENAQIGKYVIKVKEIHSEIKKRQHINNSSELLNSLMSNPLALSVVFEKYKFSQDLFQYLDNEMLFRSITNTTNRQIFNFTEQIRERYKISNIGEFLFADIECLKKLNKDLINFIGQNVELQQPRKFLFEDLQNVLSSSSQHLYDTRKNR